MKYLANPSTFVKTAVFVGAALCAMSAAQADETKIGYVSDQRIIAEALPYKAIAEKLKQEFGKRSSDLESMKARLDSMQAKLEKDAPVLSETERNKEQRDLVDLGKEFQRKQREFQEDLGQRKNEERENISNKVIKAVTQVAQDEKYDLVVQDALYHSPRVDITDKVLKLLNKQ